MEDTITKIYGGKWWKTDFHVHTPASESVSYTHLDVYKRQVISSQKKRNGLRTKPLPKKSRNCLPIRSTDM